MPENKDNQRNPEDTAFLEMAEFESSLNTLGLKVHGRKKKKVETGLDIGEVRELTSSEIANRNEENFKTKLPAIQRIRDSHHKVAQLLALNVRCCEISAITGFSPSYISNLQNDASVIELIAFYKGHAESEFNDVVSRLRMLNLEITAELLHRITEHPEELTIGALTELLKSTLDRTGHSPVAKSVSLTGELTQQTLDAIKESAKSELRGIVKVV